MKYSNSRKIICVVMFLMLIVSCVTNVSASTYKLNVEKCSQEETSWCWAACAQMIGRYHGRYVSQSSICQNVKGKVINKGASLQEVTNAISYASNKWVAQLNTMTFDGFVTTIKNYKPAVLRMNWNTGGGHVYVVSGVSEAEGIKVDTLYLIDPIAGRSSGYFSYAKLLSGVTLASGTGKYTHTWITN